MELWESAFKTIINSILILQKKKRVIRVINKTGYDHTEAMFLRSHIMKVNDLVFLK